MSDGLSREKELSVVLEEPVLSTSEVKENPEVIDDRVAPSGAACAACALAVPTSALAAEPNPTVEPLLSRPLLAADELVEAVRMAAERIPESVLASLRDGELTFAMLTPTCATSELELKPTPLSELVATLP